MMRRISVARNSSRAAATVIAGICVWLSVAAVGLETQATTPGNSQTKNTVQKEAVMPTHASGTFEVKLAPLEPYNTADGTLGRMSIDKQFHGDLQGTSKGEMLSAATAVKGSGAYVAIERVSGTLNGRSGTFALQHNGTMTRASPQLTVSVVPDSGTGQLTGLAGKMTIKITDGKHFYEFEYTLAETP
jgi:Protein of unknown function (DUF3224)